MSQFILTKDFQQRGEKCIKLNIRNIPQQKVFMEALNIIGYCYISSFSQELLIESNDIMSIMYNQSSLNSLCIIIKVVD